MIGLYLIKLISQLHIYSRSWPMAHYWQTRLCLNVILGPFRCESSLPSGQNKTYKPIVSDVSDDELLETVKELEKSQNVIAPTPALARTMPFNVFKTNRGRQSCGTRKSVKSPQIYQFNPIRSSSAMTELGKKKWVSATGAMLIF